MKTTSRGIIATTLNKLLPLSLFLEKRGFRSLITQLVSRLIKAYQRYLSPRKGFSCAHRAVHGGPSCSAYLLQSVNAHGFAGAIPLFRQRLGNCQRAYHLLKATRSEQNLNKAHINQELGPSEAPPADTTKRNSRNPAKPIDWCNGTYCDCGTIDIPNGGPCDTNHNGICDMGDCSGSDLACDGCDTGCDAGGCDAGGCEVGSCDFG